MRGRLGRPVRHGKKHRRSAAPGRHRRQEGAAGRLVLCGIAFVLLVLVKLLFPEVTSGFFSAVGQHMGRNADFQEAFAAVGRAVSGESKVGESLEDAYVAVFRPSDFRGASGDDFGEDPEPKDHEDGDVHLNVLSLPVDPVLTDALNLEIMDTLTARLRTPDTAAAAEIRQEDTVVRYSMTSIPENASLELRDLEIAYCSPVVGELSSAFGWREHPVSGGERFHYGVDLAADTGTAVSAFADGVVYATGESSTLGKYVMVEHGGGYVTLYAHCSAVTKTSGRVSMGDKIAEVGQTGTATGPHLHFELHHGGLYLNPIYYVELR